MEKISEVQTLSNMHRYCWRRKPGKNSWEWSEGREKVREKIVKTAS